MSIHLSIHARGEESFARARSDAAWRDLEKSPPLESAGYRAAGVLLLGLSAFAFLYIAYQVAVMAGAISTAGVNLP